MPGPRRKSTPRPADSGDALRRLDRPLNLVAQVEQLLRQAVAAGRFGSDRLPTEVELAEVWASASTTDDRGKTMLTLADAELVVIALNPNANAETT